MEVTSYTRGHGRLTCALKGYEPCHNEEEVLEAFHYDSEADIENPTGSVFCSHGAGFLVSWDRVPEYAHIGTQPEEEEVQEEELRPKKPSFTYENGVIDQEEIDEILRQTYYANKRDKSMPRTGTVYLAPSSFVSRPSGTSYTAVPFVTSTVA